MFRAAAPLWGERGEWGCRGIGCDSRQSDKVWTITWTPSSSHWVEWTCSKVKTQRATSCSTLINSPGLRSCVATETKQLSSQLINSQPAALWQTKLQLSRVWLRLMCWWLWHRHVRGSWQVQAQFWAVERHWWQEGVLCALLSGGPNRW